jgi:hypothetical protein
MRRVLTLGLVVALLAAPAWAKPKGCLSEREMKNDQLVRHGVFLREASRRCEFYAPGSAKLWVDFEAANAQRLQRETQMRARIFEREYPDDVKMAAAVFDGRLVTFHRNVPVTPAFCENVKGLLEENAKRGWGGFTKQSKTAHDAVFLDFKACSPSR